MNKESKLLLYNPQPVYIPDDAGIERAIQVGGYLDDMDGSRYDSKTLFYDMFFSLNKYRLSCIGPLFLNIGPPLAIYYGKHLRTSTWEGKKCLYQPQYIKLNLVHRVIPSFTSFLHIRYGLQKRWDIVKKFFYDTIGKKRGNKRLK